MQVYGELARILFRALFEYDVSPSARPERVPIASFLSEWAAIESAAVTLLNQEGIRLRFRDGHRVVGGGTMLRALGAAGLISQDQLHKLMELRELRHRLVHFREDTPEINREMIDRLLQARRNIESQIEVG